MNPRQRTTAARKPSGAPASDKVRPAKRNRPGKRDAAAPERSPVTAETRRAMIAEAAYFRAAQRGFLPGGEIEDWFAAEAEIDAMLAPLARRGT